MKRAVVFAETGAQFEAALGALSAAGFEAQAVPGIAEARAAVEAGAVAAILLLAPGGAADVARTQVFPGLAPASRRGVVVAIVGGGLTTGDAVRAFLLNADLVVAPGDLTRLGDLVSAALVAKRTLLGGFDPTAAARLGA